MDFCFQKVYSFHNTMCHSFTQIFLMSVWFLWSSDPPLILLLKCTTIRNPFKNLPLIVSEKCWAVKVFSFSLFRHHFKKPFHALQFPQKPLQKSVAFIHFYPRVCFQMIKTVVVCSSDKLIMSLLAWYLLFGWQRSLDLKMQTLTLYFDFIIY